MTGFPNDPGRPADVPGAPGSEDEARRGAGAEEPRPEGIRVNDRRVIDPDTYERRPQPEAPAQNPGFAPDAGQNASSSGGDVADGGAGLSADPSADPSAARPADAEVAGLTAQVAELTGRVAELTADLQRLSADYANYRRRVDRDREVQAQTTKAALMTDLLPVLDDIGRAREHGELKDGFRAVAESIESFADKQGVERFGSVGEPFDPRYQEAMTSDTSPDVTEPTVTRVYQQGYRIGERILRAAQVGVTDAG